MPELFDMFAFGILCQVNTLMVRYVDAANGCSHVPARQQRKKLWTQHAFLATSPTLRYVFGARLQDATNNPAAHTLPDDDAGNVDGFELTRDAWSATAEIGFGEARR